MRRSQRGVALILVMWAAIILSVVAASFILDRRTETMIVGNSISIARAQEAADAGIERAVFEAYRNDNAPDIWKRDGAPHEWQFDGVPVRVVMRDESAKIDINTASDALLKGLFLSAWNFLHPDIIARIRRDVDDQAPAVRRQRPSIIEFRLRELERPSRIELRALAGTVDPYELESVS